MNDNLSKWTQFLNDLEDEIQDAHGHLDAGTAFESDLLKPWAPPADLEALPLELLERAQSVNHAINELQIRTEAGREILRQEIQRVSALKTKARKQTQYGESKVPLYFDRSV